MLPLRWISMKGPVYPLPALSFVWDSHLPLFMGFFVANWRVCLLGQVGFGQVGGALHFGESTGGALELEGQAGAGVEVVDGSGG